MSVYSVFSSSFRCIRSVCIVRKSLCLWLHTLTHTHTLCQSILVTLSQFSLRSLWSVIRLKNTHPIQRYKLLKIRSIRIRSKALALWQLVSAKELDGRFAFPFLSLRLVFVVTSSSLVATMAVVTTTAAAAAVASTAAQRFQAKRMHEHELNNELVLHNCYTTEPQNKLSSI